DFKIGFLEGVNYIDPEINVLVTYAGSFGDPAKGKELTLAMFDQGADITFNVAGETGLGGIDAAKDVDKYTIGVDSDQYLLFVETDPEKAAHIVTSMMKNVDHAIYRCIKMHIEGTLNYGVVEVLNIEKGGVGLAENENYNKIVTADMKSRISEIAKKITNGEIIVGTAFGQ
ncbi:MAG: BMP family ABC transporter substrate-binding protein, partial [Spirochaetales bacterium]|nr:BMP family ABC transporter substrate-binding protein [Spirochaetales bacterium]